MFLSINNNDLQNSMFCRSDSGPTFGHRFDLTIYDNSNRNKDSYSNPGGSYGVPSDTSLVGSKNFQTNEVEVFQIS